MRDFARAIFALNLSFLSFYLKDRRKNLSKRKLGLTESEIFLTMFAQTKRGESFRPPFSKGGAVEGAEPSSPSAEGEILLSAFFFLRAFSFAPIWSKEKAAMDSENVRGTMAFFP